MYEKHGKCGTRLYNIWFLMRQRCNNPKASHYKRYGGRGIKVCDEWSNDFPSFEAWALANGYADNLTLDRINNNGNYEPSNCRWTDIPTQMVNRHNTRWETINGETHTLKEWAEISGINLRTIQSRYDRGCRGERLIKRKENKSK